MPSSLAERFQYIPDKKELPRADMAHEYLFFSAASAFLKAPGIKVAIGPIELGSSSAPKEERLRKWPEPFLEQVRYKGHGDGVAGDRPERGVAKRG